MILGVSKYIFAVIISKYIKYTVSTTLFEFNNTVSFKSIPTLYIKNNSIF